MLSFFRFQRQGLLESDPCECQYPSVVGCKDLDERGRIPEDFEPGASPQPVFHCLQLLFAKGAQWVCERVEWISVRFQQRSVTGSKARKKGPIHTIANGFAFIK